MSISIHAPARERPLAGDYHVVVLLFQSTLPQGSDGAGGTARSLFPYFNPRSRKGATANSCRFAADSTFQSTLPQGSDKNAAFYVC